MKTLYDFLFYSFYSLDKTNKDGKASLSNAIALYTVVEVSILSDTLFFLKVNLNFFQSTILAGATLAIPVYLFNIYYFSVTKQYLVIRNLYKDISESRQKRFRIIAISLIVFAIAFTILSVELKHF
jgi:hypothetical protein